MPSPTIQTPPESEAIKLVSQEKTAWEEATVQVTPKVQFNMRNMIETFRKNYLGVFDDPYDPVTGREKTWVPLTETLVENKVDKTDLDTKDIDFRARRGEVAGLTHIIRAETKHALDAIFFGEKLDKAQRSLEIDGTIVWATEEVKGNADVRQVDLLNFYIDPNAESISDTDGVIERIILSIADFKKLAKANKWLNADIEGGPKPHPTNDLLSLTTTSGSAPYVELYKRRGLAPKMVVTGREDDKDKWIPTEIICSLNNGTWIFHKAEERKDNKNKGYEEAWSTKIQGRWHGRGTAEKALWLQVAANVVTNVRQTRQSVNQLGIFKVKKSAGLTPQMTMRLAANGTLVLNDMNDVEQMVMQDIPVSSYRDEESIWGWAQRVTQNQDVSIGEQNPSSTATEAVLSNQNAGSANTLKKEGFGHFLERWLRNQFLPIQIKSWKKKNVRLELEIQEIRLLDESRVNAELYAQLEQVNMENQQRMAQGLPPLAIDPSQVMLERQRALSQLSASGNDRFTDFPEKFDINDFDIEVIITNEKVDKGVLSQNLISVLRMVPPEQAEMVLQQLFDVMGLEYRKPQQMLPSQGMTSPPGMGQQAPAGMPMEPTESAPPQTPQQVVAEANTL